MPRKVSESRKNAIKGAKAEMQRRQDEARATASILAIIMLLVMCLSTRIGRIVIGILLIAGSIYFAIADVTLTDAVGKIAQTVILCGIGAALLFFGRGKKQLKPQEHESE